MDVPLLGTFSLTHKGNFSIVLPRKSKFLSLHLDHLERLGIVRELTGAKRNRLFSYSGYVEIIHQGTELPG
jgi:hypothetical protein